MTDYFGLGVVLLMVPLVTVGWFYPFYDAATCDIGQDRMSNLSDRAAVIVQLEGRVQESRLLALIDHPEESKDWDQACYSDFRYELVSNSDIIGYQSSSGTTVYEYVGNGRYPTYSGGDGQ